MRLNLIKNRVLLTFVAVLMALSVNAKGKGLHTEMKLRLVLFAPADVDIPEGYLERYRLMADYTETFFAKWMAHWGYDCETPFSIEREADGTPVLTVIKGSFGSDYEPYKTLKGANDDILQILEEKHNIISRQGDVLWILHYPKIRRGSRGGGNVLTGGVSSGNYMLADGNIDLDGELAQSGVHQDILLKSLIHELTHALGLGHIGPKDGDDLGNSLMGPVNRSFLKIHPGDERVYLTQAAATMLWKHPLFDGNGRTLPTIPTLDVQGIDISFAKDGTSVTVSGHVKSKEHIHHVVVLDDSEANKSEYWDKAYVGEVKKNGKFSCDVTELAKANGKLKIVFCFDNGAVTANGDAVGISGGSVKKEYTYENGKFQLVD